VKLKGIGRAPLGVFLLLVVIGAFLSFITWRPVSLPFISGHIRQVLEQHYPLYEIDVQDVLVQWHPLDDTLVVDFYSLNVHDLAGDEIAHIPHVQVGVKTSSILDEKLDLRYVKIIDSRIALFRTAGGAIKFDIGNTNSGASGEILEYLLIDLAATPGTVGDVRSFPTVSLVGGKLFLGDEITGTNIRIPKVDLWLEPDDQGVACGIELSIAAPDGNFKLQADVRYRTSDQISVVDISLDEFRPAVLSEIMPGFEYLEPFEVPISGQVSGELDKFFELKTASFDLQGKNGSLEVYDYVGFNPRLQFMDLRGTYEGHSNSVKLDSLRLVMENGIIDSTGVFSWKNERLEILSRTMLSGTSFFSLAPQLFSQFPSDILAAFDSSSSRHSKITVTADGTYDPVIGGFVGQGTISRGAELDVTTGNKMTEINLAYRVDGPLIEVVPHQTNAQKPVNRH
jgi:hypothetical protein